MKKQVLLVAACCGLAFATQAQGIKIGPRIGMNLATTSPDNADLYKAVGDDFGLITDYNRTMRTGMQFGVAANIGISEMFSIQPELLLSQKGYKDENTYKDGTGDDQETSYEFSTTYIEVPVLAKVSFGSGTVKPFLTAGPYIGYWTGGQTQYTDADKKTTTNDIDFDSDTTALEGYARYGYKTANRLDFGVSLGLGVGFDVGPGQLTLDARMGIGMNNLSDEPKQFTADFAGTGVKYPEQKNRVIGISVAYLFGGGE